MGGPNREAMGPTVDATSWPTTNTGADGVETRFCVPKYATKNGGLKFPPNDVNVVISDNDVISEQGDIPGCRTTSLYSYPDDATRTSEWLVDHNCATADSGGLPAPCHDRIVDTRHSGRMAPPRNSTRVGGTCWTCAVAEDGLWCSLRGGNVWCLLRSPMLVKLPDC